MSKWYGTVGFVTTAETVPGVWVEQPTERKYYGDIIKFTSRNNDNTRVVGDIDISNRLSIVSDSYIIDHTASIRYASFNGTMWRVTSVTVEYPRLLLELGGVYNGPTP